MSLDLDRNLFDTWYSSKVLSVTNRTDNMNSTDRYRTVNVINSIYGSHLKFIRKGFYSFGASEVSYFVTKALEFRPDIISVEMYNDPKYAWAILASNGKKSFFDLVAGEYIYIPTLSEVTRGLGE